MSVERKSVRVAVARGNRILKEGLVGLSSVQHSSCLMGAS